MEESTLGVMLQMTGDNVTPQLQGLAATATSTGSTLAGLSKGVNVPVTVTDNATPQLKTLNSTLADNKMAIRELSMGTMMLGTSFMAVGVALKGTNSALGQSVGQMVMMAGSIMTAVGSTVQFISAISKTVDALQKLAASEAIAQALANPLLPLLGIAAAAIAVGGIKAMSSYNKNESKVEVNVQTNIDGKQAAATIRKQIVINQQQNATSGIK